MGLNALPDMLAFPFYFHLHDTITAKRKIVDVEIFFSMCAFVCSKQPDIDK